MKFKREVAMVLNEEMTPLTIVLGGPGSVEFPTQFIWKLHYARPSYIRYFCHTHPPGITDMSEEDRTTLKAWSFALAPTRLNFYVVTRLSDGNISIKNYWYKLETLEEWKARGKKGERILSLNEENVNYDSLPRKAWLKVLLELSYEK